MSALEIVATVIGLTFTVVGWAMLARAARHFVSTFKLGKPDPTRGDAKGTRTATLLREVLGHTRMSRLPVVAIAHWFTMISFGVLFLTLVQATGQLMDPHWTLPLIGHFPPYEWITDIFAFAGFFGILWLIWVRQKNKPSRAEGENGRRSRFFGSTFWQAYYVELTILGVALCIGLLRSLEWTLVSRDPETEHLASWVHFPLTGWIGNAYNGLSTGTIETLIVVVALIKLVISYAWMITVSLNPTMGVAWHRFLAFFNIFFKRHADGRTSLGELQPMTVGGKPFSMEAMEEMEESEEEITLGVGKVEDFTWKGLLDFSTCTECGRCQSQCPAWNTDKPLSPKMLMMTLRDHAHAKAPYLAAAQDAKGIIPSRPASPQTAQGAIPSSQHAVALADETTDAEGAVATAINWAEMSLVGQTGYDIDNPLTAYNPHGPDAVIDEDVLWSCTTCGACVEQCPVDIEHVDHIVDMRRYQNLIESAFPSELGGLFKKLESKGNPWGMGAKARMDWAKDLPFTVKVLGEDVESADEVDFLFWVGCAGAYEDRAKKTTRAVAELFDIAGVDFAVLGNGETCTGDSARRAGNEILFQMLAEQNVETLNELGATKIVVTCAHCFNTIKNEYPQLGGKYEVLHHTQLLNRLVREKKLAPVRRPSAPEKSSLKNVASTATSVTYHDPCYLGRHNQVYAPPRELIGALPGVELREMERSGEKSFCCGAGGARMWMEEQLGSRINMNRTEEAIATGAERIAVGCPFCRVMLSDGLTAKQSEGASEDIEVVDIAQMLLASVKEAPEAPKAGTTESQEQAEAEPKTAVAAPAAGAGATDAKPEAPSAEETAKTAAAVDEAGEDGDAVKGQETQPTAADANAAPSWESDASTANAAPSWEDSAPAPAAEPKAEEAPAAAPSDASSANAAPSWETDAATANAAPSWESGGAAPAAVPEAKATEAEAEKPSAPAGDDAASQNAAPSWETDAAAANAAPSWETAAAAPASEPSPAEKEEAEVTTEEPVAEQESPAPAAVAPADDSLAAQNAAPSWETGIAAATAAPATEPEAVPAEENKAEASPEPAPAEDAEPAAQAESPAATESTEDNVGGQDQVTGSGEPGQPQAEVTAEEPAAEQETPVPAAATPADDSLAARNANPSWETGSAPAAAAPATETAPEPESVPAEENKAEASPERVPAEDAEPAAQAEVTAADQPEPAADTPSSATAHPAPEGIDLDALREANAKPSWE